MSIAEWLAAVQTSVTDTKPSNPIADQYIVFAILAVVLGLMVLIFIRASARRSSRR